MTKRKWNIKMPKMPMIHLVPSTMIGKVMYMGISSLLMVGILSGIMIHTQRNTKNNFFLTLRIKEASEQMNKDEYLRYQYLDSFDTGLLEQMRNNMQDAASSLESVEVSAHYKSDVADMIQNINQYSDNMKQIISNNEEMNSEESGVRKQMEETLSRIDEESSRMNNIQSWVDLGMFNVATLENSIVTIDGKEYVKVTYYETMPDCGRRNSLMLRLGSVGMDYTSMVYLTDITFIKGEEKQTIDLSSNLQNIKDYSYGEGLVGFEEAQLDGTYAIETSVNFVATNQAWEEVAFTLPMNEIKTEEYEALSYTLYFEYSDQVQWMSLGATVDGKYDFYGTYSNVREQVNNYNSFVMNGDVTSADELYAQVVSEITQYIEYADVYFSKNNPQTAGKEAMQQYLGQVEIMKEMNDHVISLNAENEQLKADIMTTITALEEDMVNDVNSAESKSIVTLTIFALICAGIMGGLCFFIVTMIRKNIHTFASVLQKVGEGNLNVRAQEGNDEFAQFGKILNQFLDQLADTLGSVQQVSKELNDKNNEISHAIKLAVEGMDQPDTKEQKKGILQLQEMFSEIGHSVANQSASTEESLASLYGILEASKQVVEEIGETTQASEESMKMVEAGASEVVVLINKMNGIAQSVEQASEEIKELILDSKKIEEVLASIENLASQTNLLSLNASIEASRAGEEGRGFAVVASEVKKLSGETTNETQKISEIITSINNKIRQVQKANEQVISHVEETHKIADEFTNIIENMNKSTVMSAECIASLRERMNDQMMSTEEIVRAVDQISSDAQQIQSKTMETEEISKDLASMLAENLENIQEIKEYSDQMDQQVQFFDISTKE